MSRVRIRRGDKTPPELNITAFLNLMVILVPFLLITAVFSHMSILDLNLPPASQQKPDQKKPKKVTATSMKFLSEVICIENADG